MRRAGAARLREGPASGTAIVDRRGCSDSRVDMIRVSRVHSQPEKQVETIVMKGEEHTDNQT